jgi:pyruvate/2-oxoglutarate dehydrogenase complex dihydrolipoamide acyltransferase (E2) component
LSIPYEYGKPDDFTTPLDVERQRSITPASIRRSTTPIILLDVERQRSITPANIQRSTTPITPLDVERQHSTTPVNVQHLTSPIDVQHLTSPIDVQHSTSPTSLISPLESETIVSRSRTRTNIEAILVKQGKQIRALYELQKATHEKLIWIQNQIKTQNEKKKKTDLSEKVFGVSKNFHCHRIFNII